MGTVGLPMGSLNTKSKVRKTGRKISKKIVEAMEKEAQDRLDQCVTTVNGLIQPRIQKAESRISELKEKRAQLEALNKDVEEITREVQIVGDENNDKPKKLAALQSSS